MPCMHVVGMTAFNTTFSACFVFMNSETELDYNWALTRVKRMYSPGSLPEVIITDRELALMRAIEEVFAESRNLLCIWHIEKNILSNCRKHFANDSQWTSFLTAWSDVVKSKSQLQFS